MEINNNLTVTRRKGVKKKEKKGKGGQEICITDPWTKPNRGRLKVAGKGGWGGGKWW